MAIGGNQLLVSGSPSSTVSNPDIFRNGYGKHLWECEGNMSDTAGILNLSTTYASGYTTEAKYGQYSKTVGQYGASTNLDGYKPTFSPKSTTQPGYTISTWLYSYGAWTQTNSGYFIYMCLPSWSIYVNNGTFYFLNYSPNGNTTVSTSVSSLNNNEWYNFAFMYKETSPTTIDLQIAINGAVVATQSGNGGFYSCPGDIRIGMYTTNTGIQAYIDQIRWLNQWCNSDELLLLANEIE